MSGSSQPIVRARLFKIRQQSKLELDLNDVEVRLYQIIPSPYDWEIQNKKVKEFKQKLEEDNEKEALDAVKSSISKVY